VTRARASIVAVVCVAAAATLAVREPTLLARGRSFPDTTSRIAILTDQLPGGMTDAQVRFAATHYVGTQKISLQLSQPLRAVNPDFLVLHYRLAMWQSAPHVNYVVDGLRWSNDYPFVTQHESWFWHNPDGRRVASNQDGKLLMNIADPGFRGYWRDSLVRQVRAGDYDGVFFDSASPALLQWEARTPLDRRLLGTGVRFNRFPELGGRSWIAAWEDWIAELDTALAREGIPLIPNVGALATTWDNTNYGLTAGVFCEGFLDPGLDTADWKAAANQTLALARQGKIVILQNYLRSTDDVAKRKYLLGGYLLVKGSRTYLEYFASSMLEWYPEWDLDIGAPLTQPTTIEELAWNGVYRREFEKGIMLVNPGTSSVQVDVGTTFRRAEPVGGGPVPTSGVASGKLGLSPVTAVVLPPKSAEILLR
jgi:hypothetical protein